LIEQLNVVDLSSVTNTYRYSIALREYTPPKEEEQASPTSQQQQAKEDVGKKSDEAKEQATSQQVSQTSESTSETTDSLGHGLSGDAG